MVSTEYKIAYAEVLEILKYISDKEYNKIPKDMLKMFEENASKEYALKYNPYKNLKEQNISETAQIIIAILCRDYWYTKEQRERILKFQKKEREKLYQENIKKNEFSENIFNRSVKEIPQNTNEPVQLIEQKKENVISKILNKIKRIFGR